MIREVGGHPGVSDHLADSQVAAHHADGGASGKKIQHHLRGDLLWVRGYALCNDSVISRSNDYGSATDGWPISPKDTR